MNPKISVCIPVYNVENYIENCLNSVLTQSFQDFEIIVVNDATPDNSMTIVEHYARHDSRIKIYNNLNNMGLMWTRRESYKKSHGDYICFLDSDDTLPQDALNLLYQAIITSHSDLVSGQIAYLTSNQLSLTSYPNMLLYGDDSEAALKSTLRWEITHNLCGKIYRRELFDSYEYITYEHVVNAEDALLFYQVLNNINKISTIKEVVYNYYLHEESSTNICLNDKSLRGIFLWQKYRYDLICKKYPNLQIDLKKSMVKTLTSLTPSINSRKQINLYLEHYLIPFRINFRVILQYTDLKDSIKSLISYYLYYVVRIIRFTRIKNRNSR